MVFVAYPKVNNPIVQPGILVHSPLRAILNGKYNNSQVTHVTRCYYRGSMNEGIHWYNNGS